MMSQSKEKAYAAPDYESLSEAIGALYEKKVAPLERSCLFEEFGTSCKKKAEFMSKPFALILGQYSVGKSTFIQSILGKEYPNWNIGIEPTTECFTVVSSTNGNDHSVPGASAIADDSRAWGGLEKLGDAFSQRFALAQVSVQENLLNSLDLVDTPGVLSGTKQIHDRNYDFDLAVKWFAERADLVLVMLDSHKLDFSDEFMHLLRKIQMYDDKIKFVLNKADQVSTVELLRIVQAAAWNLAKALGTPEVKRMYISSFPSSTPDNLIDTPLKSLFIQERTALLSDLAILPEGQLRRRVDAFLNRTRRAARHAAILAALKASVPLVEDKGRWAQRTLANLDHEFSRISVKLKINIDSMPDADEYKDVFRNNPAVSMTQLPSNLSTTAEKLNSILDLELQATLRHFRHEMDGVPYSHPPPKPFRSIIYKAGDANSSLLGFGKGFKKRFALLDASGFFRYYDKDPASAPNPDDIKPRGLIDLAGAYCKALPEQHRSFCFGVHGPKLSRTFILAARNAEEMSTWMRLIDSFGASIDPSIPRDNADLAPSSASFDIDEEENDNDEDKAEDDEKDEQQVEDEKALPSPHTPTLEKGAKQNNADGEGELHTVEDHNADVDDVHSTTPT